MLWVKRHQNKLNSLPVNHNLSLFGKHNRDPAVDIGLDLPRPPIWLIGVLNKHPGGKKRGHIRHASTYARDKRPRQ